MKRIILALGSSMMLLNGWAQTNPPISHQLPSEYNLASPEAKALTKVADIPVNLSTGQPNISIPLYTINTGKQTIPITLTYDASGIRVEQEATVVGLGWHLDVGGSISRTVRDKDDIISGDSYNTYGGPTWSAVPISHPTIADEYIRGFALTLDNRDGVPDMYNYNANGKTGHFVNIGGTVGIVKLPYVNLDITPDLVNDIWTIVDESGTTYKFGGTDPSGQTAVELNMLTISHIADASIDPWNATPVEHVSHKAAWQLTSMTNFDQSDVVKFSYTPTQIQTTPIQSRSIVFGPRLTEGAGWFFPENPSTDFDVSRIISAITTRTQSLYTGQLLSRIDFNGGWVEFISAIGRDDLSLSNSLKITGLKVHDNNGNVVREVSLIMDYFNSAMTEAHNKRLKLIGVNISNGGGTAPESYRFNYDETLPLPSKNSFAKDHWGYYNGATSNADLIPTFRLDGGEPTAHFTECSYYPAGSSSSSPNIYNGANREASPTHTKIGTLNQITYPTGGKATFEFENNTVEPDPADIIYYYHPYTYSSTIIKPNGVEDVATTSLNTISFDIPNNSLTATGVHVLMHGLLTLGGGMTHDQANHYVGTFGFDGGTPSWTLRQAALLEDCEEVILLPGHYDVIASIDGHGIYAGTANIVFNVRVDIPYEVKESFIVGGLRVKKISYDDLQGNIHVKNFDYSDIANPSKSSGFTHKRIKLNHYAKRGYGFEADCHKCFNCWDPPESCPDAGAIYNPCTYQRYHTLILQESPDYDLSELGGVYYKYVRVTDGDGSNGSDVYEHNLAAEFYTPWEDGVLKHHWVYNASGLLFKEEVFIYNTFPTTSPVYMGLKANCRGCDPCLTGDASTTSPVGFGSGFFYDFEWRPYYMHSKCMQMSSKQTTEYFGAQSISQTENYTYDPNTLMMKSVSKNVSGGDIMTTTLRYPNDIVTGSPYSPSIQLQQALWFTLNHVLDKVLETYTSLNGNVVSGKYINYRPLAVNQPVKDQLYEIEATQSIAGFNAAHIVYPSSGPDIQIDPSYKLQSTIAQYDNRLNATEIKSEHGTTFALIWQYNKQYISSKTTNARQSQVAYSSFENNSTITDDERGNWMYDDANIISADHITGKKAYKLSGTSTQITFGNYGGGYTLAPIAPVWDHPQCIVSYWKKTDADVRVNTDVSHDGTPTKIGNTVNGWTYCEHLVDASHGVIVSNSSSVAIIDELRLYPVEAQMETATYDPLVGITTMCNVNNTIYYYEYDGLGRLKIVRDQDGNLTKKVVYGLQATE